MSEYAYNNIFSLADWDSSKKKLKQERKSKPLDIFIKKSDLTKHISKKYLDRLRAEEEKENKNEELIKQLRELIFLRNTAFYLSRENEGHLGYGIIVFDFEKLFNLGFEIYECPINSSQDSGPYPIDLFKKVNSAKECLKYDIIMKERAADDGWGSQIGAEYSPYLPEYLVTPPKKEKISELLLSNKEDFEKILLKYKFFTEKLSDGSQKNIVLWF
jgi:hypothetical protein